MGVYKTKICMNFVHSGIYLNLWLKTIIQGPAEIPDNFAKQLWVEPLAWGICPWALFYRESKHFGCHGALICRASGICCGDVFQKRFCLDSYDISSALQYSSERVSLVAILLPLRISQEQGVRKQGQRWIWNRTSGKKWQQFLPTCCNEWCRTSRNAWGECVDNKGRHLTDTVFGKWML